ncbi:CvfB family protein [Levilactobacillus bambusae]|uniref:DNA-binding protein n=1 Tax=Levilactobacillus bambusae TaxID=2024736 RepID=A0A2V1N1F8_9LACO|nr:S1-like domain-containing RNA-binding protein [Levilactobacillus bambusae]PWG01109.1 DNA-binding protein [Levilactobacillus bambusae]
MSEMLGRIVTGKVTDENDQNYFVQVDGATFLLNKTEIQKPLKLGSQFKGFAYENETHHMQLTRNAPKVQVDHYAFGTVVRTQHNLGVFVNIGLPNKDIVVSVDDLPTIAEIWPQTGDQLMIAIRVDSKHRMWGVLADEEIFQAIAQPGNKHMMNRDVEVIPYRLKMAGTRVISKGYQLGFVHPSEREREPRLGEPLKARVIGIHQDGSLNLSLKPRAYQAIDDDSAMLYAALQHSQTGSLPFTDKSNPDEIKAYFGLSKGAFKRAVGHLLKDRQIVQKDGQISLVEAAVNDQEHPED